MLGAAYGAERLHVARFARRTTRLGCGSWWARMSVKQIGKLLARAEGIAIDGLMVRRQRIEFQIIVGTLWRV